MFVQMREALGIPKSVDILEHVQSLPENEQPAAHEKIEAIERKAMSEQIPSAGLVRLLECLDKYGIKKGICTRNFDTPVAHLLSTHVPAHIDAFEPVITRGFRPPKPSPAGILHIAAAWDIISKSHTLPAGGEKHADVPLLMVGDSIDDIVAGHEAGCVTVLLRSEGKEELETDERTDVVVDRLDDLVEMLEGGLETRHQRD
ncbi:HAD-like protein [Myriangium duriaei CBS 260.36]|uniref:HAD-like protein n=1 Tax=Myriangium duriaei CBS 260.36 TaxID=1168546 RepID=A0A9P4J722_9PEZI|nr:HAD-like protein [Myriangium duriaei CBS 260.36]